VDLEKEAHEAYSQIESALLHQPKLLQEYAPPAHEESAAAGDSAPPDGPAGHARQATQGGLPQQQQQDQSGGLPDGQAMPTAAAADLNTTQQQQQQQQQDGPAKPKEAQQHLWQQLQQRAGLKALQQIIDQDKASFMAKVWDAHRPMTSFQHTCSRLPRKCVCGKFITKGYFTLELYVHNLCKACGMTFNWHIVQPFAVACA